MKVVFFRTVSGIVCALQNITVLGSHFTLFVSLVFDSKWHILGLSEFTVCESEIRPVGTHVLTRQTHV
jgi:hypothetical protein